MPKTVSLELRHRPDGVTLFVVDANNEYNSMEQIMLLDTSTRNRKDEAKNHDSQIRGRSPKRRRVLVLDIPLSESDERPPLPNAVDTKGRPFVSVKLPIERLGDMASGDLNREFTHARWTQVLVDGEAFGASDDYRLRPSLFPKPRPIQMLVSIRLSTLNISFLFSKTSRPPLKRWIVWPRRIGQVEAKDRLGVGDGSTAFCTFIVPSTLKTVWRFNSMISVCDR